MLRIKGFESREAIKEKAINVYLYNKELVKKEIEKIELTVNKKSLDDYQKSQQIVIDKLLECKILIDPDYKYKKITSFDQQQDDKIMENHLNPYEEEQLNRQIKTTKTKIKLTNMLISDKVSIKKEINVIKNLLNNPAQFLKIDKNDVCQFTQKDVCKILDFDTNKRTILEYRLLNEVERKLQHKILEIKNSEQQQKLNEDQIFQTQLHLTSFSKINTDLVKKIQKPSDRCNKIFFPLPLIYFLENYPKEAKQNTEVLQKNEEQIQQKHITHT